MGEAMKKVDHLVARAFKGAMAFVLAVGLCPVAPAMAQEGATANEEEGTAAAAVDGAGASTDGAVAGATGGVAGSEADGVQPGGVFGDADVAADGAGVGAPAQDVVENDDADSGVSTDAAEAASAADEEADESNDADAQTDGWKVWGGCEWMVDSEGCLTIRPKDGAEVGPLPNTRHAYDENAPWSASEYSGSIRAVKVVAGVKTSEYAENLFSGLSLVETMDLSGLDVSSATSMSSMFSGCSSLASLDASGWDTSSVTNMYFMFSGCSSLASLDVSGWDTSSVTRMDAMFGGCSSLASLDASGWNASSVTNMRSMFYGCSRLGQIAVGERFDLCRVTIEPSLVEGWTGKWANRAGDAFPIAGIPSGTKDVYRAQIALRDDMFEVDCSDSPYTGSEITKEIRSPKLQEGVDYEVSYSDNVSAGTASISISGIGRAVGTLRYEFNITKTLPEFEVPAPLDATYGQKLADLALPEGFSWQDAGDASVGDPGEHEYLATFAPSDGVNYEAVRDVPVKVRVFRDVDASMFSVDAAGLVYDGSAHEPAVSSGVVPEGSYSVEYRDNVAAGEATAVVSGEGFYRGSCELKFPIAEAAPEFEAPAPLDATYGQKLADLALPEGFSWQDAGDASVGDPGEHEYLATFAPSDGVNYEAVRDVPVKVRVFRDVDASMFSVDAAGLVYDGSAHEPAVSSGVVPEGSYSVEYRDNVAAGEATAVVSGEGFYRGSCELKFPIAEAAPETSGGGSVVDEGSCGQGVTYKIYDSGLMTIDGNGGVSFDGDAPYAKYASSVKVLKVGRGVTSFCDYSFYPLKQCRAVFFMGSQTPGLYKYFSKNALTNFDQDRKCSYYHDPSNDTWENFEIGMTCKPWVDGMLDIDWSSMVEFGACGDESFWVLSNDGTLSVRGSGAVTDSAYGVQQRSLVSRLVVEDGITSIGDKFTISSYSYSGFENISSVTFADSVEELPAGMLRDCSSLQKIDLPSGIKAIPDKFLYGCTSLGSVQIPDAVTKIGEESFYGCSSLQSVSFGSSVDTIGAESFAKCASLAAISLPKTVASIGEKAFSETGVVELVFPASVEEMDRSTFDKCPSLTKVVFEGAFPSFKGGSYSGNQIIGIHRANDETWQVRGKYNIGDITWYTENADGSLVEDDYISPRPSKNLEIDGGYSGDMHSGSRNRYAYYFTVDEADLFEINWSVLPSDDSCVHWSFSFTLKSTAGNEGKKLDFWYADSKTADDGCRKMSLAPGGYVIEVYGLDSHNSFAGYAGVSVRHQKRDITDASIALGTDSYEYTGTAIAPKPEVYWGETALVEGVDYNLSYQSNIEPGRGMVIIRGLGRYSWSTAYLFFDIVRSAGNYIALPGHWATGSGGWWYPYDNGGYPANEWCIIDGSYYHFDGSGYMQTGWLNLGGTWYCLSSSGIMQTGWQKIGGSWYWFDDSGAMASGWRVIDGSYYYFDGSGVMQTGWLSTGGAWYYLSGSGVMQTGWQVIGGAKYHFDASGAMASGWTVVDGSYYYFDGSGAMQTGWLNTGGAWYYLSGSGAMATGWQKIGGERYHFDGSGAMASGWSVIDGSYYYFDGSGAMQTGWLNRGGAWYWLGDSGVMATGWQAIGGAKYWFDDSGAMATGWKWIDGSCYYFDGSGVMQTDKRIDGSYVDSDGRWVQNA